MHDTLSLFVIWKRAIHKVKIMNVAGNSRANGSYTLSPPQLGAIMITVWYPRVEKVAIILSEWRSEGGRGGAREPVGGGISLAPETKRRVERYDATTTAHADIWTRPLPNESAYNGDDDDVAAYESSGYDRW